MSKKIGVLKEVDNLGRLVIPKEMRETFKLDKTVEIIVTQEGILVRNPKYELIEIKECKEDTDESSV
jgi:bifunctional DNA-binding transcriptional regulator/antitoxin component of YhaV-PrlF toxin-antitoxin module